DRGQVARRAELVAPRRPLPELALVHHFVERAHRDRVPGLGPLRDRRLRHRADRTEQRVARIELAELVLERVVGHVGDEGLLVVVGRAVLRGELGELVDALLRHRHPSRSSTATTCSGLRSQSFWSFTASKNATVVPGRAIAETLGAMRWMASRTP